MPVTAHDPEALCGYELLADALADDRPEISRSQPRLMLDDMALEPHRVEGSIKRLGDDLFRNRACDVCSLRLSLPD